MSTVSEIAPVSDQLAAVLIIALAVAYFAVLLAVALENPRPSTRGRHRRVRMGGAR